jgi:hypothetical protein
MKGAVPADIGSKALPTLREKVLLEFTIGPSTERYLWQGTRATTKISKGPWPDPGSYVDSVIGLKSQALQTLYLDDSSKNRKERGFEEWREKLHEIWDKHDRDTLFQHLEFLRSLTTSVYRNADKFGASALWHPNLGKYNLFVKGNEISTVTGWQATWTGPLYLQLRNLSPLVNPTKKNFARPSDQFRYWDACDRRRSLRHMKDSNLDQTYYLELRARNPYLWSAFQWKNLTLLSNPIEALKSMPEDIDRFKHQAFLYNLLLLRR